MVSSAHLSASCRLPPRTFSFTRQVLSTVACILGQIFASFEAEHRLPSIVPGRPHPRRWRPSIFRALAARIMDIARQRYFERCASRPPAVLGAPRHRTLKPEQHVAIPSAGARAWQAQPCRNVPPSPRRALGSSEILALACGCCVFELPLSEKTKLALVLLQAQAHQGRETEKTRAECKATPPPASKKVVILVESPFPAAILAFEDDRMAATDAPEVDGAWLGGCVQLVSPVLMLM